MDLKKINKYTKNDIVYLGTIIRYRKFVEKQKSYNGFEIGKMKVRPEGRDERLFKIVHSEYGRLIKSYRRERKFAFRIKELQKIYWSNEEYHIEGFLPTEENLWIIFGYLMIESTEAFFFKDYSFEMKIFEEQKLTKEEENEILRRLKYLWKRNEA